MESTIACFSICPSNLPFPVKYHMENFFGHCRFAGARARVLKSSMLDTVQILVQLKIHFVAPSYPCVEQLVQVYITPIYNQHHLIRHVRLVRKKEKWKCNICVKDIQKSWIN